jgi:hypothetical protein
VLLHVRKRILLLILLHVLVHCLWQERVRDWTEKKKLVKLSTSETLGTILEPSSAMPIESASEVRFRNSVFSNDHRVCTTLENNQNINVREHEYYHHGRSNHHIGLSKRKRAQRRQKFGRSNISTLISAARNRRAIFRTKTIHPRLRVCNQNWCEKQHLFGQK